MCMFAICYQSTIHCACIEDWIVLTNPQYNSLQITLNMKNFQVYFDRIPRQDTYKLLLSPTPTLLLQTLFFSKFHLVRWLESENWHMFNRNYKRNAWKIDEALIIRHQDRKDFSKAATFEIGFFCLATFTKLSPYKLNLAVLYWTLMDFSQIESRKAIL